MVHLIEDPGFFDAVEKNKTRTIMRLIPLSMGLVNESGDSPGVRSLYQCSYVVAERRRGADAAFCDAPALPGSSYCAGHLRLCVVGPGSAEGRALEAALLAEAEDAPAPPRELAHLAESAVPELLPDDPRELRVLLDHPPPETGAGELE